MRRAYSWSMDRHSWCYALVFAWVALLALLAGTVLFAGGLVVAQLYEVRARAAPFGGVLLIAGWLLYAVDTSRK